jgi:hypothetical protein
MYSKMSVWLRFVDPVPAYIRYLYAWTVIQWLALTPPALVKAHLGFDDKTIKKLSKKKQVVVAPMKERKPEMMFRVQ